jgi:hypothetical protein
VIDKLLNKGADIDAMGNKVARHAHAEPPTSSMPLPPHCPIPTKPHAGTRTPARLHAAAHACCLQPYFKRGARVWRSSGPSHQVTAFATFQAVHPFVLSHRQLGSAHFPPPTSHAEFNRRSTCVAVRRGGLRCTTQCASTSPLRPSSSWKEAPTSKLY